MEADTGEEDMEDMRIRNEIERHWKMVFGDNKGGVDDVVVVVFVVDTVHLYP